MFSVQMLNDSKPDGKKGLSLFVGVELPPPSALKRKILLKNKRLKADVEKTELELYLKGEFQVYLANICRENIKRNMFYFYYVAL